MGCSDARLIKGLMRYVGESWAGQRKIQRGSPGPVVGTSSRVVADGLGQKKDLKVRVTAWQGLVPDQGNKPPCAKM